MMSQVPKQPIYKPLKSSLKPFGIPFPKFIGIVASIALLLALSIAANGLTHKVEIAYNDNERGLIASDYKAMQSSLIQLENMRVAQGAENYSDLSLTQTQKDVINDSRKYGITVDMNDDEIMALVPRTHIEERPILPFEARLLISFLIPMLIGIPLFKEYKRSSVWDRIKLRWRFKKSQKEYLNLPMFYVEQETGLNYWQAAEDIQSKVGGNTHGVA